jgi:hypothetical protein
MKLFTPIMLLASAMQAGAIFAEPGNSVMQAGAVFTEPVSAESSKYHEPRSVAHRINTVVTSPSNLIAEVNNLTATSLEKRSSKTFKFCSGHG